MTDNLDNNRLIYITGNNQQLPGNLTSLFNLSVNGDKTATEELIAQFLPSIKHIALNVHSQYELGDGYSIDRLVQSGINTLIDLKAKYIEEGFCNFILFAIRENMKSTLFSPIFQPVIPVAFLFICGDSVVNE